MDDGGFERSSGSLFRQESVEAAHDRLGSPVRPLGVAAWLLSAFLALILITTIIFLCLGRYARRETVVGVLQPTAGALRVSALRSGVISEVQVREGQDVRRGQPLLSLTLDSTIADGRRIGEVLAGTSAEQADALSRQTAAHHDLMLQQREAISAKRAALLDQQKRLVGDAELQRQRVSLAEQTAAASRTLWSQQLMSAVQYRQREDALLTARQTLSSIERDQAQIPSSLAELAAENRRLLAQEAEETAGFSSSRAQLEEKRAEAQAETRIILTAQEAGQVAALQAKPGAPAVAGQALAYVLPKGVKLEAELWAPSRAAGFVRPGDRVRLMYDAFPYQRFGVGRGRVVEVARAPTAPNDLPVPIRTEESLYRIVVALDDQTMRGYGQAWRLAPGMRLTADMILEQQSLMAWLFDTLRAARVRATPV